MLSLTNFSFKILSGLLLVLVFVQVFVDDLVGFFAGYPPDAERYVDMLILAGANILSPFGYTEETLKDQIVYGEKQMVLKPVLATT